MRLVKKLPGPMMAASNSPIASATAGWMATAGSSQMSRTGWPDTCPASTSTSPRVVDPSPYSAQSEACSTLTGQTRPAQPSSARSPSTASRKLPL